MTWRANKTKFPKMPVPKGRKNGSRTYIDPEAFILMRHRAFLTTQQAAELLDVTHRTVLNWEKGKSRIPYTWLAGRKTIGISPLRPARQAMSPLLQTSPRIRLLAARMRYRQRMRE
jgi:DNA-binding XRE family transcriptional regulator